MNIYKVIAEATGVGNNWIDIFIVQADNKEDASSKVYKRLTKLRYEVAYKITPVKIDPSKPCFISSISSGF